MTLETIKKHLLIDDDFTEDDQYLMTLLLVAQKAVEKHIDCTFGKVKAFNGGTIPPPLEHAVLLMIGNLYNNREAISYTSAIEVPLSYNYLLDLYIDYTKK